MHTCFFKGLLVGGLLMIVFQSAFSQSPRIAPSAYSSSAPVNYVRTWDVLVPESSSNNITTATTIDKAVMTTQYIDGLGRPLQTVVKGSTPLGKDLVSPVVYDAFGREQFKYLPFAANSTGSNSSISDGMFKLNPFQQDSAFYNSANSGSPIKGQGETFFYGQTVFEASPLNRPTNSYAPGNSWVGNSKGTAQQYLINAASDSVRIWKTGSTVAAVPTTDSMYKAGELYKNVTVDENQKQVVEYKDKEGKVILKKVQLSNTPGTAHMGWLCTYYAYDDLGNLRFVLSPKAIQAIVSNWTITTAIRDELCFYYGYDARNRMTIKKVPGAGEVWMVYDKRDRLVMTQDSVMRTGTKKWLVTLYDDLNRPVKTGLWTNSSNRSYHETQAAAGTNYYYPFTTWTTPASGFELLSQTGYDNYDSIPSGAPSGTIDNTYITSSNFYTSGFNTSASRYAQQIAQSNQTRGLTTWTKVKVLGTTSTYLYSVSIYDEKGRVVQVKSTNYSGGTDIATTQYDFAGKVLRSHVAHQKSGAGAAIYQLLTINSYDAAGRLLTVSKRVNSAATSNTTDKIILQNSYDELGQLKQKKIGEDPNNTSEPLDSLSYDYNIRGWLLGVNRDYAKSTSSTAHYFGFDLGYDKGSILSGATTIGTYSTQQLNGNIAGMLWKSTGDDQLRKYDFSYDNVNRLTAADFNQYTSSAFSKAAGLDFSVSSLSYDGNGNILTQNQRGWKGTSSATIDSLLYTYISNSNKLQGVWDRKNDTATRLGDFRSSKTYMTALANNKTTTATDYSYDGNGNLVKDRNKDIGTSTAAGIFYNYLNLPDSIVVSSKGSIKYTYDASGAKLKKTVHETGKPDVVTLYMFGTYQNDTLQFLPQEEGRIRPSQTSSTGFVYDYMIKDHLGNVRMVLTEEEKQDGYPAATMETVNATTEEALYSNISSTRKAVSEISGYPTDTTYSNPNNWVARVSGATGSHIVGPSIVLKVMAGDKFNVRVSSWYKLNGTSLQPPVSPLNDLLAALNSSIGAVSVLHEGATTQELQSSNILSPGATQFISDHSYTSTKPKAYLNWILFDEQFKYVSSNSGADQVGSDNALTILSHNGLPIDKNGYLYVYVSNETPNLDVFFDNLQVTHIRGRVLEETHYYPFGLTMQGISSKAAGGLQNRYKFNDGTELNTDFDINLYETNFRSLDPQLGRFWQVDPLSMTLVSLSPYQFATNNPILFNDPFGLDTVRVNGEGAHKIQVRQGDILAWTIGETTSYYTYDPSNPDAVNGFVGEGMKAPDQAEVVVTASTPKDKTTPWQLGAEWATGRGPREHHFGQTDPFTRLLMKHEHITDTKNMVANQIYNGARGNIQGTNNYQLGGLGGVPKYIRDYSTLLTGGLTGNLAVTYLGSYGLKYEVVSIDEQNGTAQVHFFVSNTSTIESATHPPVIGYTQWWSNNIGKPLNNYFSSGAFSKTTQTVEWTETIQWK